jgi:pimeloyl-ACP methyl ester carboxylesterase
MSSTRVQARCRPLSRVGVFARAVALDMAGYGQAGRPRDFEYNVPGYARHLEGALKDLRITRAHLGLHDFGVPWGCIGRAHTQRPRSRSRRGMAL